MIYDRYYKRLHGAVEATENDSCEQSVAVLIVETLCQGVAPSRHSYQLGDDCLNIHNKHNLSLSNSLRGRLTLRASAFLASITLPNVANEDRAVVQSVINAAC